MKHKRIVNKELLASVREMRCLVCGFTPCDPAHVRSRGAGGGDTEHNIMPLCRADHSLQHSMGIYRFALKFPAVMWWLKEHGWGFMGTRLVRT